MDQAHFRAAGRESRGQFAPRAQRSWLCHLYERLEHGLAFIDLDGASWPLFMEPEDKWYRGGPSRGDSSDPWCRIRMDIWSV
ncbi:hypothetical protein AA309_09595 [Microvirga vignae]|uniref:Uncharacterized protein n=1 Tax=Microvirga vignae TaxID=1225564 RepID=A0A0H1RDF9_9HYPH|nr:hypothetical protein AA309_09595 [Microvirga vignae]